MNKVVLVVTLLGCLNFSSAIAGSPGNAWIDINNTIGDRFKNNDLSWNEVRNETLRDALEDIYDGKTCKKDEVNIIDIKICEGIERIVKDVPAFLEEAKYFHFAFGVRRNNDDYTILDEKLFDPGGSSVGVFEKRLEAIKAYNSKLESFKQKYGLLEAMGKVDSPMQYLGSLLNKALAIKDYEEQVRLYEKYVSKSKKLKVKDSETTKRCAVFENKVKNMKTSCDHIDVSKNDEKKLKELKKCAEESNQIMFDKQYKGCPSFQDF